MQFVVRLWLLWLAPWAPGALPVCIGERKQLNKHVTVKAYARAGDAPGARAWFDRMVREGARVTDRSVGKLLSAAANAGLAEQTEHGGNQLSNSTCLTLVFFKSDE